MAITASKATINTEIYLLCQVDQLILDVLIIFSPTYTTTYTGKTTMKAHHYLYNKDNMTSKWMIHRTLQKAYDQVREDWRKIDEKWDGVYGDLSCVEYQYNWGQECLIKSLAEEFGVELIKTTEDGEQVQ